MEYAIAEQSFSPPLSVPIHYSDWRQITPSLDEGKAVRKVQWLYSFVSIQGDRSVCVYQAPCVDAVREASGEAGMSFQQVWHADLWLEQDPTSFPQSYPLVIAEVNYAPPMTKTRYEASKQQVAGCFHELNVQHILSLVTLDGTRSTCVFSSATAEAVRSLYRKINQPFEQVWRATLIRPTDPN